MGDKRREGLTVNRCIDNKVQYPAKTHFQLQLLPDKRFWMVNKFADLHSHNLSGLNKVHHFYSYQIHRSRMNRTIMTNLDDVRMHPSNITRVVNEWILKKIVNKSVHNSLLIISDIRTKILSRSSFLSSNIFKRNRVRSRFFLCQWGSSCRYTMKYLLGWWKSKIFLFKFFWRDNMWHNAQLNIWTYPSLHSQEWIIINNLFCSIMHCSQMSKGIYLFDF